MIETLVELWTDELVMGGRIELEHFIVIDVQTIERAGNRRLPAHTYRKISIRASKRLRLLLAKSEID